MSNSLPPADSEAPTAPTAGADSQTDTDRRAALTKLGALAAWTAPAMLTLVLTPRSAAAS